MLLINLFGTPGAGKSTGAAYLFSKLKMKGINAELVTEFAKDKVYEKSEKVFKDQLYILGKQHFRISRVQDEVDVIVTDSPILNSSFYNGDDTLGKEFDSLVKKVSEQYDSLNYLIVRKKKYNPKGRFQTEKESDALLSPIRKFLLKNKVDFEELDGTKKAYKKILKDILEKLE